MITNRFVLSSFTTCFLSTWLGFTCVAPSAPTINNDPGSVPGTGSALLQGTLIDGEPADVTIYWGEEDGGTNVIAWENSVDLGAQTNGPFSTTVTGLLFGIQYAYRTFASNITGIAWANSTTNFGSLDSLVQQADVAWLYSTKKAGGSTILNSDSSLTPLDWNVHEIKASLFSLNPTDPAQLVVNQAGDYLVAFTLPMTNRNQSVDNRRTCVRAELYVDGVAQGSLGAIGESSYMRGFETGVSHYNSSDHFAALIPNVASNSTFEVRVQSTALNFGDVEMQQASLYVEAVDTSRTVFAAVTTDGDQDMTPETERTVVWEETVRSASGITHAASASNIVLDTSGAYLVFVNMPYTGIGPRESARLRVKLDGVTVPGGQAKQGYIRAFNGHNDASVHWSGMVLASNANQTLTITAERETILATTTPIANGRMSIVVEKVDVDSDVFFSRATQVTVDDDNWNQDPPGQQVEWETDVVIDEAIYTHELGTPEEIVIEAPGDYLLAYNDSLVSGGAFRANPMISIEVDGVPVSGAETKTHFIRNASDHLESSASLVFYLNDLMAGSIVRVRVARDVVSGTVNADEDALLFLWRKTDNPVLANPVTTNITSTNADLNVTFDGIGAVYDLALYWGLTDGGTNAAAWSNVVAFGSFTNQVSTNLNHALSGLVTGGLYSFSWRASNGVNDVWTDSRSFFTLAPPVVENGDGATPGDGVATLEANLSQGEPAGLSIYWGDNDGGTNRLSWDSVIDLGSVTNGTYSNLVTGLTFGEPYYYRSFATNTLGRDWATTSIVFTTQQPVGNSLMNDLATSLTPSSGVLNASFSGSGSVYSLSVYWGPTDGATDPGLWSNSTVVGTFTNVSSTNVSFLASGLTTGLHFFAWQATNAVADLWAQPTETFSTIFTSPVVNNGAGASAFIGGAVLNGDLVDGNAADVTIYWGESDGGTDAGLWENSIDLGPQNLGPVSAQVTNLLFGLEYFYRVFSTNVAGSGWAPETDTFNTLNPTPMMTVNSNLLLWLDAEDSGFTFTSNNNVDVWMDRSGNGNDAIRDVSAGATAIQRVPNAIRGQATVQFAGGAQDYFNLTSPVVLDTASGRPGGSAFVIAKTTDSIGQDTVMSTTANRQFLRQANSLVVLHNGTTPDPSIGGDSVTSNRIRYVDFNFDRVERIRYFVNGSPLTVNNHQNLDQGGWSLTTLGGEPNAGCCGDWNGDIAEILFWDRVLTDREQEEVGAYLALKYDIASSYPLQGNMDVVNLPATNITETSADLKGTVTTLGGVLDVVLYYGPIDGGTNEVAWSNVVAIGSFTDTTENISFGVADLNPNTTNYYTFRGSNHAHQVWAQPAVSFATTTSCDSVDLALTKTVNITNLVSGTNLAYSIVVSNSSVCDASGVVVTDTLPAEVTFLNSVPPENSMTNGLLIYDLGNVGASSNVMIELQVSVNTGATVTVTNLAQVVTSDSDTNLANNVAAAETTLPDADVDDIPDFVDPDDDNDGASDRDEGVADTDPNDPLSLLRLQSIDVNGGNAEITWQGGVLATQVVERSTNLVAGIHWHAVFTNFPPTPIINSTVHPTTPTNSTMFYRILVPSDETP